MKTVPWFVLALSFLFAAGSLWASFSGRIDSLRQWAWSTTPVLTAADFPPGVTAPVGELVTVPMRSVAVGAIAKATSLPLLWATGSAPHATSSRFRAGYSIDVELKKFSSGQEMRQALLRGADHRGVDMMVSSVAELAMAWSEIKEAVPKVILLVGRSRGFETLVASSRVPSLTALRGHRIAVEPRSAEMYFGLWVLGRLGLSQKDVNWVKMYDATTAPKLLRESQADLAIAPVGLFDSGIKDGSLKSLASTADAPHLLAHVLVCRGDFAARYPDAVRRVVRGLVDATNDIQNADDEANDVLGQQGPEWGDPSDAIAQVSYANLQDNLIFFGLAGESPVTFQELFQSATRLAKKLDPAQKNETPNEIVELNALKFIASARGL